MELITTINIQLIVISHYSVFGIGIDFKALLHHLLSSKLQVTLLFTLPRCVNFNVWVNYRSLALLANSCPLSVFLFARVA